MRLNLLSPVSVQVTDLLSFLHKLGDNGNS